MSKRTLVAAALSFVIAASVHAAPPTQGASADDMDKFLTERGLVNRLQQMGQSVQQKTSELVVNAMGFLGVPYKRGGNSAESGGFDCSGFVRAMYEQTVGLILPRRAEQQAAATQKIDKAELQPGDLVFFNTLRRAFSHVGIYVGDGKFIHSPRAGAQVRVEDMRTSYWQRRFDGARRVGDGPDASTSAALAPLLQAAADAPAQQALQAGAAVPAVAPQAAMLRGPSFTLPTSGNANPYGPQPLP